MGSSHLPVFLHQTVQFLMVHLDSGVLQHQVHQV